MPMNVTVDCITGKIRQSDISKVEIAGLTTSMAAAKTALDGATASIAGLTARMDAVEITGGTAAERIGILEQTAAEAAPGLRNIVDNHSVELGFDNAPVLTESEDEDGNPRSEEHTSELQSP